MDAAERLFVGRGFHATSIDAIADAAGFTKGAVYSNFASKEALFLTVYERRVERGVADIEAALAAAGDVAEGVAEIAAAVAARRGRDDRWLALFHEFWAHVIRHAEHRARFAALHARAQEPLVVATERLIGDRLPVSAREFTVAMYAMQTGLSLERLTQPDVVDATLAERMVRMTTNGLDRAHRGPEEG